MVVTVHVNPPRYEDPAVHPGTPEADCELCRESGADVGCLPATSEVYRGDGSLVRVVAGPGGEGLEAAGRPGHFDGVLTVMPKTTNLVRPDAVFLGTKDFQQSALFRGMVFDLRVPVEVVGVETVRESEGLAPSSRNVRRSPAERLAGLVRPRALTAGAVAGREGGADADVMAAACGLQDETAWAAAPVDTLCLRLTGLDPEPRPDRTRTSARTRQPVTERFGHAPRRPGPDPARFRGDHT